MARFVKEGQEYSVVLRSKDLRHAELFSSFEYGTVLEYTVRSVTGDLPIDSFMILTRDADGEKYVIPGFRTGCGSLFTVHTDEICKKNDPCGLFFCVFDLGGVCISPSEYGEGYYIGSYGDPAVCFQLTVYRPQTNRATGYEGGIMYQIFPDRFCRAGGPFRKENAVTEEDWYALVSEYAAYPGAPLKNNHFFGGTLYGIAEKLFRLKELGVTLLYLNPIFKAASNHRYDTGDYEHVDELLGGDPALEYLIGECRKCGISVILDGVFNHTGSDSRYFNKYGHYPETGAYQSKDSPYFEWYCFTDYPDRYESWWGIDILPKVRSGDSSFRDYIAGPGGILERYLSLGIAGWRLDVADELPDRMLDAISGRVKACDRNGVIIGEVWEDASNKIAYSVRKRYFMNGQLTSVMNYPLKNAIISFMLTRNADDLYYTERMLYRHYPKCASDMLMNILSSHDTPRILNMLAGPVHEGMSMDEMATARLTENERAAAVSRLRHAVLLQMLLPGIPCIYYGDEAGMEGDRDPFNRQTYKWGREDREVMDMYSRMTALRTSLPMLADAYYRGLEHKNGVYAFERFNDRQRLYVAVNLSEDRYATPDSCKGRVLYPVEGEVSGSYLLEPDGACVIIYEEE
ncbi:MAG: DUF3459 domain-containing protein [Clostridia bacterium]|nr:DUF3459 domain-containing protein [Clostridia bacterium]